VASAVGLVIVHDFENLQEQFGLMKENGVHQKPQMGGWTDAIVVLLVVVVRVEVGGEDCA
jgi:NAD/NADP transhydrogenase beta subunit